MNDRGKRRSEKDGEKKEGREDKERKRKKLREERVITRYLGA